ncbi:hypothetical protein D3C71_1686570 [compost metagenome]
MTSANSFRAGSRLSLALRLRSEAIAMSLNAPLPKSAPRPSKPWAMAPTSLPATPSLSMALVNTATPGASPSWLLPAAKIRRMSNIGSSWASTNSTLVPSAVFQVCTSSLRWFGALPLSSVSDCSF